MSASRMDATTGAAIDAVDFLSDLAAALHLAYLPSDLVELRVRAAARGLGIDVDAFALQSLSLVQLRGRGDAHLVRTEFSPHWRLEQLRQLVLFTDQVAAGRLPLPAARVELDRIRSMRLPYSQPVIVLAYAVYGAAVAARVGGRGLEMLAAGLVGVVAGAIHFGTLRHPVVDIGKSFLAALLGSLSALLLGLVLPPFDATRAVFGAVTLLVPAMVLTLGAYELASEEAVEAGVIRLAYGLLRFMMMAAGILAAARLWILVAPPPPVVEAVPLPTAVVAAALAVGGLALVACMQARPSDVPWIAGAVLFAWGAQEATQLVVGGRGSPLVAGFLVALAGGLYGRLPGKIPATVVYPALLQLAPGFLGTQAVLAALRPGAHPSAETFFEVLTVAVQLVLGLIIGAAAWHGHGRPAPPGTAG